MPRREREKFQQSTNSVKEISEMKVCEHEVTEKEKKLKITPDSITDSEN